MIMMMMMMMMMTMMYGSNRFVNAIITLFAKKNRHRESHSVKPYIDMSTKFGLLIDFDLLKAVTSTNIKPEVVFSGCGHLQKWI